MTDVTVIAAASTSANAAATGFVRQNPNGLLAADAAQTNAGAAPAVTQDQQLAAGGGGGGGGEVCLLLHFDGTDGSTTITDSSSYALTCSVNGTAHIETDQSLSGGSSLEVSGAYDRVEISSPAGGLGAGDFCVEGFARFASFPSYLGSLFINFGTTDYPYLRLASDYSGLASLNYMPDDDSGLADAYATTPFSTDTWTHWAIDRLGSSLKVFIGGAEEIAVTSSRNFTVQSLDAWRISAGGGGTLYTEDVRVTLGGSRYQTAFSPPAAPLDTSVPPAGGGGGDQQANRSASVASGLLSLLPININCALTGQSGLIFHINPYRAGTSTLQITIGPYTATSSLPIRINPRRGGTSALPIAIYPELSAEAAADFVTWAATATLGGTDISSRLVGKISVEFSETAASIAELSYLPAAGTIDPVTLCNQPVTIEWVTGGLNRLLFTGVVSSPQWTPQGRLLTLDCTGDLQQRLDGMDKDQLRAQFPAAVWSEMVFGPEDDLSGWDFAQDLLSTTDEVLWQDAAGTIRSTSIRAKAVADFSYTNASILDDTLSLSFADRSSMTNQVEVRTDYRYVRRRERTVQVSWQPVNLNICDWLIYGFELPQRSMIESAAASGGWAVLGSITYTPVWIGGAYGCLPGGEATYFVNNPYVTEEWCIGASWTAARRWLQDVTEWHYLTVRATDSVNAAGTLAVAEQYALESEETDDLWETSLEYTEQMSGASVFTLPGSGDLAENLDSNRVDFEAGQQVALEAAKNTILKSHRGTQVTFQTPFAPMLDLSHTVSVDTSWLDCKGKVARLRHELDIDSGEATTEVTVALSRRNGAGSVTDDPLDPPEEPDDPDETVPTTYLSLGFWLGGNAVTSLAYDEAWEDPGGYVTNWTPDISWNVSSSNPAAVEKQYDEAFYVTYPEIDSSYTSVTKEPGEVVYEVDVPEDPLTITA